MGKKSKTGCLGCGCLAAAAVIIGIVSLCMIWLFFTGDDTAVRYESYPVEITDLREHFTPTAPQSVTVMFYMIGSDLESDYGNASDDIDEMLNAALGDNINIVIETGGTMEWQNDSIADGVTQRHIIKDNKLQILEDLGEKSIIDENELSSFIKWSAENYPADRNILIFWDHGAGTVLGFGSDEFNYDESLELSEISTAIEQSGVKFDIVGFDACLMGTLETAYMLEPYADYMIASEETEPSTGWYYTNWLTALSDNVAISTTELGKLIIDDYVDGVDSSFWDSDTLALVELREIPNLYSHICEYFANAYDTMDNIGFKKISTARSDAKALGEGDYEQIDILSFINQMDENEKSNDVAAALNSAVKYMNSSDYDTSGLAMYFPYDYPEVYSDVYEDIESFGYGKEIKPFFDKFLSIMLGGQYSAMQSDSDVFVDDEVMEYDEFDWFSDESVKIDEYEDLTVDDKGDYYALSLSDDEWASITDICIQVFLDDGSGYIDLGTDNSYEFDDDGDLIIDYDYTWIALDGQIAPFYFEYESNDPYNWYTYGYVPATLNGEEEIEIMVYWDDEHTDGYVAGYRPYSGDDEITAPSKGYKAFIDGDVIDLSCDFYDYNYEYDGVYSFGENITVDGEIAVSYEDVGDFTTNVRYVLTDVYNNTVATEMIEFTVK